MNPARILFVLVSLFFAPPRAYSQLVHTGHLTPSRIEVRVNELPQPYATSSARRPPRVAAVPANATLYVPNGFRVNVFAYGLDRPRWLAVTPDRRVLVTETRQNRITALTDTDGDGVVDDTRTFADSSNGLNIPFGMAFAWNHQRRKHVFLLGNTDEVRSYEMRDYNDARLWGRGKRLVNLPGGGYNQHWTRNVVLSPHKHRIYVSVGSRTNADVERLPRASVFSININGSDNATVSWGLRNPVGLDFHPVTGELYTTVNERDGLGDDLVPDYFTRIRDGEFYGWPYVYLTGDNIDPRHSHRQHPNETRYTRTPDVLFQAHSAALGLAFYDGATFPRKYRHGAFVAFRGSWNRHEGTGYKIVFIPFDKRTHRPLGYYEDFMTGFLTEPSVPRTWGRPVGLKVIDDGSLLVTEEANGRIYRISYDPCAEV